MFCSSGNQFIVYLQQEDVHEAQSFPQQDLQSWHLQD